MTLSWPRSTPSHTGSAAKALERIAEALEQALVADADLGPRWPQIQALGLSLKRLCRDLEQEIDRMAFEVAPTPEAEAFRDSLYRVAEAFKQLGVIAQAYPSTT